MDIPDKYILAEGPQGLERVLDELLAKTKSDADFATQEHFVLYKMGAQESLIKVDTSKMPFEFWHYDLLGRPMTSTVKDIITHFLWEKCGEKDRSTME